MAQDLAANVKLLCNDGSDAFLIGGIDNRAHLGAEDTLADRAFEQVIEVRHRLHHLDAIGFVCEAFVDFQEGNDLMGVPEVFGGWRAIDFAIHGAFKQDRANDLFAIEGWCLDDAGTHLMDQAEHFFVIGIGVFVHAVEAQSLGGGATRLVKRCDEAILVGNLPGHLRIGHDFNGASLACVEFANFAFKYRACLLGQQADKD